MKSLLLNFFSILFFVSSCYFTFIAIYYFFIGLKGFGKATRDYELIEDKAKICILVASHNEEKVIASTVENLREIDYNKDLYDIIVVNDNSTDNTEDELKRVNAKYINTNGGLFPREAVGKPGGLQYALRFLGFEKIKEDYDLIMVLDADNHVSPNILRELNSQWHAKSKPEAIQSYLDSKNHNKILSFGYTNAYIVSNRFFQLAKYRLGLPNAIGGTGFIVSTDYLIDSGGFNYKSLTEDLEMEIEIANRGGRILWNHFGRIFDEKPEDIKVSIKQRTRWMQGHWYVAFTNFVPLCKKFIHERKWKYADQIIYLFGGAKSVQILAIFLAILFSVSISIVTGDSSLGSNIQFLIDSIISVSIVYLSLMVYQFVIIPIYAYKQDSNIKYNLFKVVASSALYAITFLYCQIVGLFKWRHQHTWAKTSHIHSEKKQ